MQTLIKTESDSLGDWDCLGNWKPINICFSLDKKKAQICISMYLRAIKIWKNSPQVSGFEPPPCTLPQSAAAALRCNDYAVLHVHPSNIFHPLLLRFHLQLWFLSTFLQYKEMSHNFGRGQSVTESCSSHWGTGMQIYVRPVARGDKKYVRAIVNQHVTNPAGDWFPARFTDHVWLFTHNCRAPHSMYWCTGVVVVAHYRALFCLTRGCVYQRPLREEH